MTCQMCCVCHNTMLHAFIIAKSPVNEKEPEKAHTKAEEGSGNDVAEYGSYVKLAYQTTDVKGDVVDSNDNFVTKLGQSGLAWDEVAMKMNVGERVKLVADKQMLYFGKYGSGGLDNVMNEHYPYCMDFTMKEFIDTPKAQ